MTKDPLEQSSMTILAQVLTSINSNADRIGDISTAVNIIKENTSLRLGNIEDGIRGTRDELKELNTKTTKNKEWIDQNNQFVTKEMPEIAVIARRNDKRIYAALAAFTVINAVIGFAINYIG